MDIEIRARIETVAQISGCVSPVATITGRIDAVPGGGVEPYEGPYEVTPSQQIQTLSTDGKRMTADVTINPIPSNYGLITYNGFEILVS